MAGAPLSGAAGTVPKFEVRAPGRVNLIGEHTDYNDGYVLPMAIDRACSVRAAARRDTRVLARSAQFAGVVEFDLGALATGAPTEEREADGPARGAGWGRYLRGVAWSLRERGHALVGADLEITSDVPAGAGLSSSAAFEVACGAALLALAGIDIDPVALALDCQRAENECVRARCGIMDQFVSCNAREGHALLLDCRTLACRHLPLRFGGEPMDIVVCDSMVRHSVAGGEYNRRRAECESGLRALAARREGIRALRDIDAAEFAALATGLDPLLERRCRHVVTENARVQAAAAAIGRGDAAALGALMTASHRSLSDDFEASCPEIDALVEIALECDGVAGARMTGGGFGGCTVNLVQARCTGEFTDRLARSYRERCAREAQVRVCRPGAGLRVERLHG